MTEGCKGTFWADGNALHGDSAGGYITVMSLSKLIELYIKGEFTICKLYLNYTKRQTNRISQNFSPPLQLSDRYTSETCDGKRKV